MSELLVKVVWEWPEDMSDGFLARIFKRRVQNVFMDVYNKFSNRVNRNLNDWNQLADELGYTDNLPSGIAWWDTKYCKYLHECYETLLMRMTQDGSFDDLGLPKGSILYIGDELELHLIIKECLFYNVNDIDLSFHLVQVEA